MNKQPVRLYKKWFDEDHILVEQLQLLMKNSDSTVAPVTVLALLTLFALIKPSNALALSAWCLATITSIIYDNYYARHCLKKGITAADAPQIAWLLMVQRAAIGLLWGSLVWVALDTASPAQTMLMIAVVAGMAGGAVSALSPILLMPAAYIVPQLMLVAIKMWSLSDPSYKILSITCVLYGISLLGQARNGTKATRAAIQLRFENIELLETLQQKTQIAEQANMAKSKFLAAASHDLRQPIHAQGLFLNVLSRTQLNLQQLELVTSATAANDASAEMLNTLLDFSRIEAGVITPQIQAFSLQDMLNKIEREFAPQADAKGLRYRSRETTLTAWSDPSLLELILRNLVSNAIRYTHSGGLLVTLRKRGSQALLEVRDTGIGIDSSQQQEVFREFYQLGNPERDRSKGLGLGLAIVAGISRTLNHAFSLNSTPNRGSAFCISLPIYTMPLQQALLSQPAQHNAPLNTLQNVRVLVIDDDETVRNSMLYLLRDWGCNCVAADSIEESISLVKLNMPDVIISDYRLRWQRTGAEAIATLRELTNKPLLPALLITGDTAPERLREAHASGIPILHKPVSPSLLHNKLARLLNK